MLFNANQDVIYLKIPLTVKAYPIFSHRIGTWMLESQINILHKIRLSALKRSELIKL
jgi:hypothetical protein